MTGNSVSIVRRALVALAVFGAMAGLAGTQAQARVWVGVGVPLWGPGFYPPPYYYPPPAYYPPPPPVIYAPPPQVYTQQAPVASPRGQSCYAGPYVCPMDRPVASGTSCYCPGNGGQRAWGRAN